MDGTGRRHNGVGLVGVVVGGLGLLLGCLPATAVFFGWPLLLIGLVLGTVGLLLPQRRRGPAAAAVGVSAAGGMLSAAVVLAFILADAGGLPTEAVARFPQPTPSSPAVPSASASATPATAPTGTGVSAFPGGSSPGSTSGSADGSTSGSSPASATPSPTSSLSAAGRPTVGEFGQTCVWENGMRLTVDRPEALATAGQGESAAATVVDGVGPGTYLRFDVVFYNGSSRAVDGRQLTSTARSGGRAAQAVTDPEAPQPAGTIRPGENYLYTVVYRVADPQDVSITFTIWTTPAATQKAEVTFRS